MSWIVVTGTSGDLGYAIAACILSNSQYGVVGISRTESDPIKSMKQRYPLRYKHIHFDLTDASEIKQVYKSKLKPLGKINGLVNNSAYAYDDIVTNAKVESLERMFKINVLSPILLTKYIIRDMLLKEVKGSIVNISSVSAKTGYKGLAMYASTKGALESFSKGVAREWGSKGIRCNCVAPGFMDTNMTGSMSNDLKQKIFSRTCLRKATEMNSVAQMVLFLLGENSESITGETIAVDSGTT